MECNTAWVKSDGTLWTFGGMDELNNPYNDMWKFDINTNLWTWMGGGATGQNYGQQNVASASNLPAARGTYTRWQDANDNFYLYAGISMFSTPTSNYNDLWKYNSSTNQWTWIGGDSTSNTPAYFDAECIQKNGIGPGGRFENRTAQISGCSNVFWTFGGMDSADNAYNDLWNFNTQTLKWTWASGDSTPNSIGNYGPMGVGSTTYLPPSRCGVCLWVDRTGALWLWSGLNFTGVNAGKYDDLWKFVPDTACLHASLFVQPTVSASDSVICPGDTIRLYFQSGGVSYVSPASTSILQTDSSHVLLFPQTNTTYTIIEHGLCGGIDTFRYPITIAHYIPVASTVGLCSGSINFYGQTITGPGTYRDTFNNPNGCDTIMILHVVPGPPVSGTASAGLCAGGSISYNGMLITAPGTYIDTLRTQGGCDSVVTLTVTPLSAIYTSASQGICQGDTLYIHGLPVTSAGIYIDTLGGSGGCDSIVTLTVQVLPKPISSFVILPVGDSLPAGNITVTNTSVSADSILWLLNNQAIHLINDSTLPIADIGDYCIKLIATSANGCTDTSQQCIFVYGNSFAVPNAFTPNGDGKNELFYPVIINPLTTQVTAFSIYNRWGQLMYDNAAQGWDGNYKNDPQPTGMYTYYLTVTVPVAGQTGVYKEIHKQGIFALLR